MKAIFFIFGNCLLSLCAIGQRVQVINYEYKEEKIFIYFKVNSRIGHYQQLQVYPSVLAGNSQVDSLVSISGDTLISKNEKNGTKIITCDLFNEAFLSPKTIVSFEIKTRIKRIPSPKLWGLTYSGNSNAPFGIGIQRLGDWGFYSTIKTLNIPKTIDEEVGNDGILERTNLYAFAPESRINSFSLSLGGLRRVGRYAYVYLGTGFGAKKLLWERKDLVEENGQFNEIGSAWVVNSTLNYSGALLEGGLFWRFGKIIIDTGIGTIQGKAAYANFGLGYILN